MTAVPVIDGLERLLVALLVGLLIGLDRERAEERKARESFAGIRTFPLIALAGCLPMLVLEEARVVLLIASFLGVGVVVGLAYWRQVGEGMIGATTEMAAIATFLLGALAGAGHLVLAGATGVAVAVLLVAKPRLEGFSRALTAKELSAVLEMAVITVIVLPILPNRGFGPWAVLNPREIWWVVVLVAGLSFSGFIAVRLLGERRGLTITGAVGGLVSSTAVTMAMAERSREGESAARPAAAAAVLASAVMAARVALLAGAINRGILPRLLPAVAVICVIGLVAAMLIARRTGQASPEAGERIRNPFSMTSAAAFAALYAGALLVVQAAREYLGSGGMFAAAALSSVADVDAVTIAFTRLGPGEAGWRTFAAAVTLAAVMNTLVKLGIGLARGAGSFRRILAVALGSMAAAGTAAGVLIYLQ